MPTLVGNLDLTRQVQRLLDVRGALALSLSGDILPVVNAFNLDDPPFHTKRGAFFGSGQLGSVGNNSKFRIANVSSADECVAVIRYLDLITMTADYVAISWEQTTVPLANLWGESPSWDAGRKTGDLQLSYEASPGPIAGWFTAVTQARVLYRVPGPIVLRKGYALNIGTSANVEAYVHYYADIYDNS